MILVNNNWEQIYDLQDVSKIIRENYNKDLADEFDRLIPKHTDDEYFDLQLDLDEKDDIISDLEDEIFDLESEIKSFEEQVAELENELNEIN